MATWSKAWPFVVGYDPEKHVIKTVKFRECGQRSKVSKEKIKKPCVVISVYLFCRKSAPSQYSLQPPLPGFAFKKSLKRTSLKTQNDLDVYPDGFYQTFRKGRKKKKHVALLKCKVFHVWKVQGTTNRDSSPVAFSPYDCLRHLTYRPRSPPATSKKSTLGPRGFHMGVHPITWMVIFLWSHFCFITRICHLQTQKNSHYLHYPNCSMKKKLTNVSLSTEPPTILHTSLATT